MFRRSVLLAIVLCSSYSCGAQQVHKEPSENEREGSEIIFFSVDVLKASNIALKQFLRDQPKADTKHFEVGVEEFEGYYQITLFPASPLAVEREKTESFITIPGARENEYGRSIGYDVSKKDGKILQTFYPRD